MFSNEIDDLVDWMSDNMALKTRVLYDQLGNGIGNEIKLTLQHNSKEVVIAEDIIYFE